VLVISRGSPTDPEPLAVSELKPVPCSELESLRNSKLECSCFELKRVPLYELERLPSSKRELVPSFEVQPLCKGAHGSVVVKALCCKPEGGGFKSR
jgi:hypothetical protein